MPRRELFLVSDHADLAGALRECLEDLGFVVTAAPIPPDSGQPELFIPGGSRARTVLYDTWPPEMNGWPALRGIAPGDALVVVDHRAQGPDLHDSKPRVRIVTKPFTLAEILEALGEA